MVLKAHMLVAKTLLPRALSFSCFYWNGPVDTIQKLPYPILSS